MGRYAPRPHHPPAAAPGHGGGAGGDEEEEEEEVDGFVDDASIVHRGRVDTMVAQILGLDHLRDPTLSPQLADFH